MKTLRLLIAFTISLAGCTPADQPTAGANDDGVADAADTVYTNGRIYTVNEGQAWAEAVAIKDGKFLVVGSNDDATATAGESTNVVDLGGKFVMPGIVDMHAHPFTGVDMGTGSINLTDPGNLEVVLEDIRQFVAAHPDRDVFLGGNWSIGLENDNPDKKLLDEIAPDVPVFIIGQQGHIAWVNSKALEMAGIDETVENEGVYIFNRYEGTNEPSGTVKEMGMVLVMNALHYLAPDEFAPFFEDEIERYSKYGVTAIQTAEGSASWLQGSALLEKEGRLDVRLFPALDWLTSQLRVLDDEETLALIADWKSYQTELIRPHYVKIFADGAADSHTVLMKEPFADAPGNYGEMYLPFEQYREGILGLFKAGMTVHVHALGDGSASKIIDIFEEAEATYPDSKATLHLAHNQSTTKDDLDRFAKLQKSTMSFSPMLAVGHPMTDILIGNALGEERYQQIFNVRAAIEKGITLGFGSDFPSSLVPEPNSFFYMEGWITRQMPGTDEYGTVNVDQGISVEQVIRGFTLGGAEALGADYSEQFGSLEVGKSADMVVLDRNPLEIPTSDIHNTEVVTTVFLGREVYSRD
jgi:hypothetical protein